MLSALVRIYTALNIDERGSYILCMATFGIVLCSACAEVFYYKTAPLSSPGVFPQLIVSGMMYG